MAKVKKTSKSGNKTKEKAYNSKVVLENNIYNDDTSKIIKCFVFVVLVCVVMYFLTVFILEHSSSYTKETVKTSIQYDEVLAGTSFKIKDSEYLVLFYNLEDDEDSKYADMISDYEAKDDALPIYYVDLGNGMNKSVVTSEESNKNATSSSELKINGETLIKFKDNQISDYIEGVESITNYLK